MAIVAPCALRCSGAGCRVGSRGSVAKRRAIAMSRIADLKLSEPAFGLLESHFQLGDGGLGDAA